jgi:hypothetical protein
VNDASIALHEAGHAVAALTLDRHVSAMHLTADGGTTTIEPPSHRDDARARKEWIVICLAGHAAETRCKPPEPEDCAWRL